MSRAGVRASESLASISGKMLGSGRCETQKGPQRPDPEACVLAAPPSFFPGKQPGQVSSVCPLPSSPVWETSAVPSLICACFHSAGLDQPVSPPLPQGISFCVAGSFQMCQVFARGL